MLNLAVDSGGTKVRAILYDENFLPVRSVCVGSMRPNTTSPEQAQRNLETLEQTLFQGQKPEIGRFSGVAFHKMSNYICENYTVHSTALTGEITLGLSCAGILGDGMLVISGTGSKVVAQYGGKLYAVGGYGAIVSDEGSGYWMGRAAFDAAIKSYEERGEKTLLQELICEKLGGTDLRGSIRSIYAQDNMSPAAFVASCAELVSIAAYRGDAAALGIAKAAGESLGAQACALARLDGIPDSLPITVSGSVWRGHPAIFGSFVKTVRKHMPERPIVIPKFEPIIGAIITHYYETHGIIDENLLETAYADHIYSIQTERADHLC